MIIMIINYYKQFTVLTRYSNDQRKIGYQLEKYSVNLIFYKTVNCQRDLSIT